MKNIPESLVEKVFNWMGKDNIVWFKHVKGLKGTVAAVLKLNYEKKRMPAHPIHLREGMQIRNFMRHQPECEGWNDFDFDNEWSKVIEKCIVRLPINTQEKA